jgi:hypothetical protein
VLYQLSYSRRCSIRPIYYSPGLVLASCTSRRLRTLTGLKGGDKRAVMKIATVRSVCECQAKLEADLAEDLRVLAGRAQRSRTERPDTAPANLLGNDGVFHVGWFCPFCIRNTLRSFTKAGLGWREVAEPSPPTEPAT